MSSNFIDVFENVISDEFCDKIVNKFEFHSDSIEQSKISKGKQLGFYSSANRASVGLNISSFDDWSEIETTLRSLFNKYLDELSKKYILYPDIEKLEFENFFVIKYQGNNEGFFTTHIDAGSADTINRVFSLILYLNNVDHGGETYFLDQGVLLSPKKGRLAIFPSIWTHPHKAQSALSSKYVIVSWLGDFSKKNEF